MIRCGAEENTNKDPWLRPVAAPKSFPRSPPSVWWCSNRPVTPVLRPSPIVVPWSQLQSVFFQFMFFACFTLTCFVNFVASVKLHDPRYHTVQPSDFEPIVYTSSSFVETSAEPNSQIEAPGLLECDCSLIPANPLGRPDSEYHQGRLERANEPTALKFEHLTQNVRNPNSKVEDTVATLLSSSTETNN